MEKDPVVSILMSQENFNHLTEWVSRQGMWLDLSEMKDFLGAFAEDFDLDPMQISRETANRLYLNKV